MTINNIIAIVFIAFIVLLAVSTGFVVTAFVKELKKAKRSFEKEEIK